MGKPSGGEWAVASLLLASHGGRVHFFMNGETGILHSDVLLTFHREPSLRTEEKSKVQHGTT